MKVKFDVQNVDPALLRKMPSNEKLVAYKTAKEEFEKNGSKGESPKAPGLEEYKPMELVGMICTKAMRETYTAVKTNQINHMLNLFDLLSKQVKVNKDFLELPETDVRFIRKAIAKTLWPTDNETLLRFVMIVEQSFINASK